MASAPDMDIETGASAPFPGNTEYPYITIFYDQALTREDTLEGLTKKIESRNFPAYFIIHDNTPEINTPWNEFTLQGNMYSSQSFNVHQNPMGRPTQILASGVLSRIYRSYTDWQNYPRPRRGGKTNKRKQKKRRSTRRRT